MLTQLWQDCVCLIAPNPNNPDPADQFDFATDMDLSGQGLLWYARPQLFFNCTVASTGSLRDTASHRQLALVFFSTFKPINLLIDSVMKREGGPMFYDSASSTNLPSLYLCRAENVLGRVPLMPCCVGGNSTPTLPHRFGNSQGAVAETSAGRGNGSRCTSATSGCGGMAGASHAMSLWKNLRRGVMNEQRMLDVGQLGP